MVLIPRQQLNGISFPDCEVATFELSATRLECRLDGVHLDRQGMVFAPVCVTVSSWNQVCIERFDTNGANPMELDLAESGGLREICEWTNTDGELKFAGFERETGWWQRYCFMDAEIQVWIEDLKERLKQQKQTES
jgi:hypothetical protein